MSSDDQTHILKEGYALIAALWCSPQDVDGEEVRKGAEGLVKRLESSDQESARLLSGFLNKKAVSEEEYIDLFELAPQCSLYLGSHVYDEPKTCAGAAVSDRNGYMIELLGIYKHFGQALDGKELPDYLPLMVEFLSLTAESQADPVREKFIKEYLLPYLPPLRSRLDELKTPYLDLIQVLERILHFDLECTKKEVCHG